MITPSPSWTLVWKAVQKLKVLSTTVPILTKPDVTEPRKWVSSGPIYSPKQKRKCESFRPIPTCPRIVTWLYRTFPNPAAVWTCCTSVKVATTSIVDTRCVLCLWAQEVFKSPIRSHREWSHSTRTRSDLSRETNLDFWIRWNVLPENMLSSPM